MLKEILKSHEKLSEKLVIVSISIEPKTKDSLVLAAKKGKCSISRICRILFDRFLPLLSNEEETPVVLKIPHDVSNDNEKLKKWLQIKSNAITDHFSKNKE